MNLTELHTAYKEQYGEPDYLFSVFAEDKQVKPNRLDIVYDFPIEEEERYATTLTTLGMATYPMSSPCENAELVMDILGQWSREDYDKFGKVLANLVWNRLKTGLHFAPNMVIKNSCMPFFDKMSCLFVMDYGHSDPEWLEGIDPVVRLLEVVPIYESEANTLERIEETMRTTVFVQAKGNWDNPNRKPILLFKAAINTVWGKIERWYNEEAPIAYQRLKKGASEEEIKELEEKMELVLPEDFVASLLIHNGGGGFHDYEYLSIDQIYKFWSMMNELKEEGAFASYEIKETNRGIIKDTWWHSHWIPFALDSGGNSICIDLSPEKKGTYGQIIYKEKEEGPLISNQKSFFEWLWAYQQDLYRGCYFVDKDGFIQEKL
jgi:cell wall assembly regulator SMI1